MADGASPPKPTHLDPSELGTKQYWDAIYATELTNHASNPREEGTIWFDDSDAEAKICDFLDGLAAATTTTGTLPPPLTPSGSTSTSSTQPPPRLDKSTATILDLGCGNGSLLLSLRAAGWRGRLLGVDYSAASVALARRVAASRVDDDDDDDDDDDGDNHSVVEGSSAPPVEFEVWDILAGPLDAVRARAPEPGPEQAAAGGEEEERDRDPTAGWDVVLDKGTFDAISLSDERDAAGRRVCEGYRARVRSLLRPGGGLFLVTSCNWTEAELGVWFGEAGVRGEEDGRHLEEVGRIKYPSFSFGGVKGQAISSVCFARPR
ncbi:methyltransferase domain-containing protein [Phialemonium atrogriseum]|uniref:Protein-lysine N-methyltransferase EFM4 n=1 Tax=Phialemonium atrogriseum TaxID=1093897 RepID=A0AAJ0C507_9PEZI|nr:methyltransferase domain-containing protein [Phialemonium atrogriseum]KAK1769113.1 methyltransferase domain-containing protein [Phialemonium atrogriseum]